MANNLYRKEAIEYKKSHWKGKALLLAGIPTWIVTLLSLVFFISLILTLRFCSYTQRIDVRGEVITVPHSINVFSPQQGFILNKYINVGSIVEKGTPLYEIDVSRNTTVGNVSDTMNEVFSQKIANAEKIIQKTLQSKQETLDVLNKQIHRHKVSLKETNKMLADTNVGLAKMKENLSSYDTYLKKGLITKDQY